MIVVADSSPLNYLIQIQCDSLLQELYKRVFVPMAVIEELRHPRAQSRSPRGFSTFRPGSKCAPPLQKLGFSKIWTRENAKRFSSRKRCARVFS